MPASLSFAGTYAVGSTPYGVAVGDFNGDGRPDFATADFVGNSVSVLLNNGNGTFPASGTTYAISGNGNAVAVGDFNGDGNLDIVAVTYTWGANVLLGNGDGTFQPAVVVGDGSGVSVAVGDFNGDGKLDLVTANCCGSTSVQALLGNGDGTFQAATTWAVGGQVGTVAVGDFNGDGTLDVVTASYCCDNSVSVLVGNGDGTFLAATTYAVVGAYAVAVADFNGDSKLDVVTTTADSTVGVLLGNGDGTLQMPPATYAVGYGTYAIAVADFNGDGKPDIATADFSFGGVSVLPNNGDGTFPASPLQRAGVGSGPDGIAIGDFNGDGKPDLVTSNYGDNSATVVEVDMTPPTITPPSDVTVFTGPGDVTGSVQVWFGSVVANDDSGNVSVASSVPDGSLFSIGATVVTWTAIDSWGNTATATQAVTVIDDTPPTITAPPNVTANASPGDTTVAVSLGAPAASDNSGVVNVTSSVPDGSQFPIGVTPVTWTATDPFGNIATATQTVTVTDHTAATSCQGSPDGDLVISPDGVKTFTVYCSGGKEYLSLVNTGGAFNFSQYTAGGYVPGTNVVTHFTKIRLDPQTLTVDIDDLTFATSTGGLTHGPWLIQSVPYAAALGCYFTGLANIDLTGTPFAVANRFFTNGSGPSGTVLFDGQTFQLNGDGASAAVPGAQSVDLRGAGSCGGTGPIGTNSNIYSWVRADADISAKPALNLWFLGLGADSTPPVITRTVSGTQDADGWYRGDVTVTWNVTDPESGFMVLSGCATQVITGGAVTSECTARSPGGTSSDSVTVRVDKVTTTLLATGPFLNSTWFTGDVTVQTTGSSLSGDPVTCSPDQFQTIETTATTFTGSCTSTAGLTASATRVIRLDKTPPSANLAVTAGTPGANGWYTSNVTVRTTGADAISGVTCRVALAGSTVFGTSRTQSIETAGTGFIGRCTNGAGLVTNATPLTVKLDKTPPTLACPSPGPYPLGVALTLSVTADDTVSGPVGGTLSQTANTATPGSRATTFVATNNAGLSATQTCPYEVTIRPAKELVLVQINAAIPGASKEAGKKLSEAAERLASSLDPALWIDGNRLDAELGNRVFEDEKEAVQQLAVLLRHGDKDSSIADETLSGWIEALVGADQALAQTAIDAAVGGDAKELAEAVKQLDKGDAMRAAGKPGPAIEHYRNAWKKVQQAQESLLQACVAPPLNIVGWWPGDGHADDITGSNHGVPQGGTTFAPGVVGQALSFDGSGSVTFAGLSLTAIDNWTMEAWINPASLNQFSLAVSNGFDNGSTGNGYAFGVGNLPGNPPDWLGGNLQGLLPGVAWLDTGYTFPAANQWYHVVMLRDSGTTKFFVDGVQTSSTHTTTPRVPTMFRIGSQDGIRFFNGLVDEVALYNRALSGTEIQALFAAGVAGKCK